MSSLKRAFALIVAAVCLAVIAMPAFADLIIDPEGDNFYKKHMNECSLTESHSYVSVGEGGIEIYNEPGGKVIATLPAGEKIGTNCIYSPENGDKWGYNYDYQDAGKEGWFRLADTLRLYDGADFDREHSSGIKEYEGGEVSFAKAVLYEYPGGPINWPDWNSGPEGEGISFSKVYTDENGRQWGFIGYHYGHVDSWVCIDDPENAELSAAEQPLLDPLTGEMVKTMPMQASAEETGSEDENDDDRPSGPRQTIDPNAEPYQNMKDRRDGANPWLIGGIVAAAAAVCAAVLAVCFKKKKTNE